ncbi:MAG: hypothetical protein PHT32_08265, partial [Candidatus Omnitrophica bacterium]|nr:hypothetical protein [Candidatus Omnitrophota bacterium]
VLKKALRDKRKSADDLVKGIVNALGVSAPTPFAALTPTVPSTLGLPITSSYDASILLERFMTYTTVTSEADLDTMIGRAEAYGDWLKTLEEQCYRAVTQLTELKGQSNEFVNDYVIENFIMGTSTASPTAQLFGPYIDTQILKVKNLLTQIATRKENLLNAQTGTLAKLDGEKKVLAAKKIYGLIQGQYSIVAGKYSTLMADITGLLAGPSLTTANLQAMIERINDFLSNNESTDGSTFMLDSGTVLSMVRAALKRSDYIQVIRRLETGDTVTTKGEIVTAVSGAYTSLIGMRVTEGAGLIRKGASTSAYRLYGKEQWAEQVMLTVDLPDGSDPAHPGMPSYVDLAAVGQNEYIVVGGIDSMIGHAARFSTSVTAEDILKIDGLSAPAVSDYTASNKTSWQTATRSYYDPEGVLIASCIAENDVIFDGDLFVLDTKTLADIKKGAYLEIHDSTATSPVFHTIQSRSEQEMPETAVIPLGTNGTVIASYDPLQVNKTAKYADNPLAMYKLETGDTITSIYDRIVSVDGAYTSWAGQAVKLGDGILKPDAAPSTDFKLYTTREVTKLDMLTVRLPDGSDPFDPFAACTVKMVRTGEAGYMIVGGNDSFIGHTAQFSTAAPDLIMIAGLPTTMATVYTTNARSEWQSSGRRYYDETGNLIAACVDAGDVIYGGTMFAAGQKTVLDAQSGPYAEIHAPSYGGSPFVKISSLSLGPVKEFTVVDDHYYVLGKKPASIYGVEYSLGVNKKVTIVNNVVVRSDYPDFVAKGATVTANYSSRAASITYYLANGRKVTVEKGKVAASDDAALLNQTASVTMDTIAIGSDVYDITSRDGDTITINGTAYIVSSSSASAIEYELPSGKKVTVVNGRVIRTDDTACLNKEASVSGNTITIGGTTFMIVSRIKSTENAAVMDVIDSDDINDLTKKFTATIVGQGMVKRNLFTGLVSDTTILWNELVSRGYIDLTGEIMPAFITLANADQMTMSYPTAAEKINIFNLMKQYSPETGIIVATTQTPLATRPILTGRKIFTDEAAQFAAAPVMQ